MGEREYSEHTEKDLDGNSELESAHEHAGKPEAERKYPCVNCGAAMLFRPGTTHLKCPYCGTENEIPPENDNTDYLKENDFLTALVEEEKRQESATDTTAEAVRCESCGAISAVSAERTSDNCPYCGGPLIMQNSYAVKLNVQAVLPFNISSDKALDKYSSWVASRWFAPSDFKRRATRDSAMNGVYMPYWTYDSDTYTKYIGQRGDAYYVDENYQTTEDGKTVTRVRQVRHVRWSSASGMVHVLFDDVLVPASDSLPANLAESLAPWDLGMLKEFRKEFLSGFVTESYKKSLKEGFEYAKQKMASKINSEICDDIGGDEQRISHKDTDYKSITFKHILLPVWLSAYAYGGKTYRFIVNAQTGEATGERPWSYWKIGAAVAFGLAALGTLIYFLAQNQ